MSHPLKSGRGPRVAIYCAAIAWSTPAMAAAPASQSRSFHLDAPIARVFPLFTALGERAWAPGWEPIMLSGEEARGSAFRIKNSHGVETTWIVTDYRPADGRVSYARIVTGSNIGLVDVVCDEVSGGGTDVTVRYTLTPLTDAGRAFVDEFLESDHYAQMIDHWRTATSGALARSNTP